MGHYARNLVLVSIAEYTQDNNDPSDYIFFRFHMCSSLYVKNFVTETVAFGAGNPPSVVTQNLRCAGLAIYSKGVK